MSSNQTSNVTPLTTATNAAGRVLPPITSLSNGPSVDRDYPSRDHSSTLVITPTQLLDVMRQLARPEREIESIVADLRNRQKFWHTVGGVDVRHDETEWPDGRFGMELELMGTAEEVESLARFLPQEPDSEFYWYDQALSLSEVEPLEA